NPWVYAFEDIGSKQPYAQGTLPPSVEVVPNPPFVSAGSNPQSTLWQAAYQAQPTLWPYVFLDSTTSGQPYAPGTFYPQAFVAVVTYVPYNQAWLSQVLQGWQPQWPYVFFDTTTGAQPYAGPTPTPPPTAVVVVAQTPYTNQWMGTVLQSWIQAPPLPILPRQLNPSITAVPVNNPPFGGRNWLPSIVAGWQPP